MIDQPGPRPPETRDRNLSPVIARIRDDGPALDEADEAPGPWSPGPVTRAGMEALRAAPPVRNTAPAAPPERQLGSRASAPGPSASQVPPAKTAKGPSAVHAPPTASARRLDWLLPGALVAASVVALGVVGVLYLAPPKAPSGVTASAGESAMRAQLAALQETITALSERIESLTTEEETGQVEALGERLDRMSRQVANLALDDRLPGDLDRRLEALAQGLDAMASRMEQISNPGEGSQGERPQGTGLADGGGAGKEALPPPPLAGGQGQGAPAIGAADLEAQAAAGGIEATAPGKEPRWPPEGPRAEVAEGAQPQGTSLAQARAQGEHPGAVGTQGVGSRSMGGSPEPEAPAPGLSSPAESVPAEPLSAESLPADEPLRGPVLSQDNSGGQAPAGGAPTGADPAEDDLQPPTDQAKSNALAASWEEGEPPLAGVASADADAGGQTRLRPTGPGGGSRVVRQPVRQRVATASKSQPKGPVSKDDAPIRRPPPRVVDDLF